MGIRKKISLGFVIIASILLFSSIISIYEFVSMRKSVSNLISDNIASINTASFLQEVTDEYNFDLLKALGSDSLTNIPDVTKDTRFGDYINQVKNKFTTKEERMMTDSIQYAYSAYMNIIKMAPDVWHENYYGRRQWYFERLYPVYLQLRNYIQGLTHTSQKALSENSANLNESFYRSIMPGVIAVSIGLILVILFNYFVNYYFISPLLKIRNGLKNYIAYQKTYNINLENNDELRDLDDNIKEMIDTNKKFVKNDNQL